MNKVLFAVLFSVLLLVPIGAQQVFGTHLTPGCPPPGGINTDPRFTLSGTSNFCIEIGNFNPNCSPGYGAGVLVFGNPSTICGAPISGGTPTNPGSCQDGTVLDANDHCVCELQNNQCIGGVIIDTDAVSLLAGTIGIDPLLTGLIGITIGGLAVQAVWFVHRRRKD